MSRITERQVPLCRPSISPEEADAVAYVLRSGWLAHGEYNHKFEEAFAQYIGVRHAITMNSCASTLEISLKAAGIRGEVIIPSMTFVATANAVVSVGATPVFCEVDPATRNVTADTIASHINSRTEAVIPVHYGGQPCQMDAIVQLCEKNGLLLVEDSAETLGATWHDRQAGSFGIGCFSFFPTKNITTGEGGMLTCQDDAFARRCRTMISHGIGSTTLAREREQRPWLRSAEMAGHNFRMPNPLAALGYYQLQRLNEMNRRRIALAKRYDQQLISLAPLVTVPSVVDGATHVYQMYTIEVAGGHRDALLNQLRRNGVSASVHFDPPVHLHPYYSSLGGQGTALPVTERLARELISLPIYPDMTEEDQDWVIHCLHEAAQIV